MQAGAKVLIWDGRIAVFVLATVDSLGNTALELAQCFALVDVQQAPEHLGHAVRVAMGRYLGFMEYEEFERRYWGYSPEREAFGGSAKQLNTLLNRCGELAVQLDKARNICVTAWVTKRGSGTPMDEVLLPDTASDAELGELVLRELDRSLAATTAARLAPKAKRGKK